MKLCFFVVLVGCFLVVSVSALPTRVKRVSDQRLAELETLLALTKMSGKLVTVPLGYGKIDPARIGRRRRSGSRLMQRMFVLNHSSDYQDPYNEELERIFEED